MKHNGIFDLFVDYGISTAVIRGIKTLKEAKEKAEAIAYDIGID